MSDVEFDAEVAGIKEDLVGLRDQLDEYMAGNRRLFLEMVGFRPGGK